MIVEVSAPFDELITKEVPVTIFAEGTEINPAVPPGVLMLTIMMLPVVTAVVFTITSPATNVAVPILAFAPVAIFNLVALKFVKTPVDAVLFPIAPGEEKVAPLKEEALRLATLVVLLTTKGAVPVVTVEVNCPLTLRLVPVAAPITGVTRVGDVDNTTLPVPVVAVLLNAPPGALVTMPGVFKVEKVMVPLEVIPVAAAIAPVVFT